MDSIVKKLLKRALLIFAVAGLAMSTAIAVIILWDMPPLSVREYFAMEGEWNQARSKPKGSSSDRLAYRQKFAERCLQLAAKYPNSSVELAILMLADEMAADTLAGHNASELLRSQIAAADMDRLARAISREHSQALGLRVQALHIVFFSYVHSIYRSTEAFLL